MGSDPTATTKANPMNQIDLLSGAVAPLSLEYLQDPGHGWIAADMDHVKRLGIADKISAYSYLSRDGKVAYLEEDCDAGRYIEACKAAGIAIELREHHCNSDSSISNSSSPPHPTLYRLYQTSHTPPYAATKMFKTKSTPKTKGLPSTQLEDQPPPPYSSSSASAATEATKAKTDTPMSALAAKQWESFAKTPQMSLYDPYVLSMN